MLRPASVLRCCVITALLTSCGESTRAPADDLSDIIGSERAASDTISAVHSLTVDGPRLLLRIGDSVTLRAMARDYRDDALPGRRVSWVTTDTAIALISPSGAVRARGTGVAQFGATSGGLSVWTTVVVLPDPVPVVRVMPGDDLQAAVAKSPVGTTFQLEPGTYRGQSIVPKDGMSFIGARGVILDGQGTVPFAFRSDSGTHVTLRHLSIVGYASPVQDGAIHAEGAVGWVVDSCEVARNAGGGIRLGDRMRVTNSFVHHNGQIGILGTGDAVIVEGNEIAYNNPADAHDMYWEAGGTKFARTRDLVVRRNFVHHNHGPGLWTDIDNVRSLVEDNRVEDNYEAGILHEISYRAVIRGNVLRRNGTHAVPVADVTGAGILVSVSADVEVTGNTVEGNKNGIVALQDERGRGAYGAYQLRNLFVHDNTVVMPRGVSGIVTRGVRKIVDRATYRTLDNRFDRNRYTIPAGAKAFEWEWGRRTFAEWQGFGLDTAGAAP